MGGNEGIVKCNSHFMLASTVLVRHHFTRMRDHRSVRISYMYSLPGAVATVCLFVIAVKIYQLLRGCERVCS